MENLRHLLEMAKLESKDYVIWQAGQDTPSTIAQFPLKIGPRAWSGILVEEEVQVRLGDFSHPSTAFILALPNQIEINNGRITLIGPDLARITQPVVPFAMGVLVTLKEVTTEIIKKLNRTLQFTDEIEGFMQRSMLGTPRYLVAKILVDRGISFQHIGRGILHLFHTNHAGDLQAMEVFFLTTLPGVVRELQQYRNQALQQITRDWQLRLQKYEKYREDCEFEWDCANCDYQRVCEELRHMIQLRKAINPC